MTRIGGRGGVTPSDATAEDNNSITVEITINQGLVANRESPQDLPADLIDGLPESAHFEGYLTPLSCHAGAGYSGRLLGEFARFSFPLPWISGWGNQRPNRNSKEECL